MMAIRRHELPAHVAFIPKANRVKLIVLWQVFWLVSFPAPSHPDFSREQWHNAENIYETYSSGYCSGVTPDSLLNIPCYKDVPKTEAKIE